MGKDLKAPNINTYRAEIENLPALYKDCGFKSFEIKNEVMQKKYDTCLEFAKLKAEKKSIVLFGKVGTGKTHLAVSIMKNFPKKRVNHPIIPYQPFRSIFIIADEFFQELNDSQIYRKSKLEIIKGYLRNYDCICLDDLGIKNFTEAKRENLYLFINRAYLDKKKIILTTNFTMEEIEKIDERISSRLTEMAQLVAFNFNDYRTNQKL